MVTELKIVSGDPALDLVNTVGDDRVPDPLDRYESFAEWAARVGVIGESSARRLAVFRPLAKGAGGPPQEALRRLVALAGAAVERGRLEAADGGFRLVWGGDHLERPLWPLAAAAVDLLRSGPLDRLKACAGCPWLFLDTSRNRSRHWCTMDDCGSRSKMRRYRARRATAGR